jgi:hypothetical protein
VVQEVTMSHHDKGGAKKDAGDKKAATTKKTAKK